MLDQILFLFLVACSVGLFSYFVIGIVFNREERKITDRLSSSVATRPSRVTKDGDNARKPGGLLKSLALTLAKPFMPEKSERMTGMRQKLAMAGIYDPQAVRTIAAARFVLLIGGVVGGYLIGSHFNMLMMGVAGGGLGGYLIPNIWLSLKIKGNQQSLDRGLPDALDLMVICVEAGLTVDAALQRVGDELSLSHPALAREFGIAHMETRVGVSRQDAFRNLSTRTGNRAIQALSAMLIQADRFGTSIATALRVQAESMRIKRQNAAEELAAKASVKMSFPLVLFVFPATLIVLAGPTIIGLMESPLMKE